MSEAGIDEAHIPQEYEVLGIAEKLLGYDRIMVRCQDGATRLCRIRGKMKKRIWIREGDAVLISPWDFEFESKGDVFWRYTKNQMEMLRGKGYLSVE